MKLYLDLVYTLLMTETSIKTCINTPFNRYDTSQPLLQGFRSSSFQVFGPLLKGEFPQLSSEDDTSDSKFSEPNGKGQGRLMANEIKRRGVGQATDLASKPTQMPAPITLRAPVQLPGPPVLPPGSIIPGPKPPPGPPPQSAQKTIQPVLPQIGPQPMPLQAVSQPMQPVTQQIGPQPMSQGSQFLQPGSQFGTNVPQTRPPTVLSAPPVNHVDQILATIAPPTMPGGRVPGTDQRVFCTDPKLLAKRVTLPPPEIKPKDKKNNRKQQANRGRKRQPGQRQPRRRAEEATFEEDTEELPKKFQSFQLPKAPEKKLLRPINEPDSSTQSSNTSENAVPESKERESSSAPQSETQEVNQLSESRPAQIPSQHDPQLDNIHSELLRVAINDPAQLQSSLIAQGQKNGFTNILPSFLRPPTPPPPPPNPPAGPTAEDHDMGIHEEQNTSMATERSKRKQGRGSRWETESRPVKRQGNGKSKNNKVSKQVETQLGYAIYRNAKMEQNLQANPKKEQELHAHSKKEQELQANLKKRKEPEISVSVPGLEPEPFLEVFEERADKRQKQIHMQAPQKDIGNGLAGSERTKDLFDKFSKQHQQTGASHDPKNETKKMTLEEELQFNLSGRQLFHIT